jgi:hypothetical protein
MSLSYSSTLVSKLLTQNINLARRYHLYDVTILYLQNINILKQ